MGLESDLSWHSGKPQRHKSADEGTDTERTYSRHPHRDSGDCHNVKNLQQTPHKHAGQERSTVEGGESVLLERTGNLNPMAARH